jgi:acrylyl-CoA reductase (NADPH)
VGSVAVALLGKLGYLVTAATGKQGEADYLKTLGASAVIDRAELSAAGKPLQKERWAAVVDAVGSHTLVNALAQTRYGGVVAACGLAQGADLPATVMPFILRGVTLAGIDSVMAPIATRRHDQPVPQRRGSSSEGPRRPERADLGLDRDR